MARIVFYSQEADRLPIVGWLKKHYVISSQPFAVDAVVLKQEK
jgi:hypothetical protein